MRRKLEKLIVVPLMIGMLSIGLGYAQQAQAQQQQVEKYDACNLANPNYCTECRDENARDFAKCGEIDYRNINLLKSDRNVEGEGFAHDTYGDKGVFIASIGQVHKKISVNDDLQTKINRHNQIKLEIFRANKNGENQKRLTYSEPRVLCYSPVFLAGGENIDYHKEFLTEDYAKKYPDEKFRRIDIGFKSGYALALGELTVTPSFINLSDNSERRLSLKEEARLLEEREKQKK